MKYALLRAADTDRTKKGNLRKNAKQILKQAAAQRIPSATPARPPTGLDSNGQSQGDRWGNVYAAHSGGEPTLREMHRANKFGRYGIQPLRSRVQRLSRKQRTGGVR